MSLGSPAGNFAFENQIAVQPARSQLQVRKDSRLNQQFSSLTRFAYMG